MKALACVNSKAEKVAGIIVNGEPNGLGIWLGKDCECWLFLERRFLTRLDDASDVAVVPWALLPMPLTLVATPNVPPFLQDLREGTSAWETLQAGQHLLCCAIACHPPGASPGLGGGQVSALPLAELWRQGWPGCCCGSVAESQPATHALPVQYPALTCWSASIHLLFWWVPAVHSN